MERCSSNWSTLTIDGIDAYKPNYWYVCDVCDGYYDAWIIKDNNLIYLDGGDCNIIVDLDTMESITWLSDKNAFYEKVLSIITKEEIEYFENFTSDRMGEYLYAEIVVEDLIDFDYYGNFK